MKNIVLTGMMGSGKTTAGRVLARRLDRSFVDTDDLIVRREGRPVSDIFAAEGEQYFRRLELEAARELGGGEDLVIATGGGMVLQPQAMALLRQNGVIFFLNRPPAQIFDSVSMEGRPLAQGGREDFLKTFRRREPRYWGESQVTIQEFSSPEATVEAILSALRQLKEL